MKPAELSEIAGADSDIKPPVLTFGRPQST